MSYSSGPLISENFPEGGPFRDPLEKAPPEVVVEQLSRNNPEALTAMMAQMGVTEKDLEREVRSIIERNTPKVEDSTNYEESV